MKIVINTRIGGFRLSEKAILEYCNRKGGEIKIYEKRFEDEHCVAMGGNIIYSWEIERNDPDLVCVVEKLGEEANGILTVLKIIDIPDGVEYTVVSDECGREHVAEKHRIWY